MVLLHHCCVAHRVFAIVLRTFFRHCVATLLYCACCVHRCVAHVMFTIGVLQSCCVAMQCNVRTAFVISSCVAVVWASWVKWRHCRFLHLCILLFHCQCLQMSCPKGCARLFSTMAEFDGRDLGALLVQSLGNPAGAETMAEVETMVGIEVPSFQCSDCEGELVSIRGQEFADCTGPGVETPCVQVLLPPPRVPIMVQNPKACVGPMGARPSSRMMDIVTPPPAKIVLPPNDPPPPGYPKPAEIMPPPTFAKLSPPLPPGPPPKDLLEAAAAKIEAGNAEAAKAAKADSARAAQKRQVEEYVDRRKMPVRKIHISAWKPPPAKSDVCLAQQEVTDVHADLHGIGKANVATSGDASKRGIEEDGAAPKNADVKDDDVDIGSPSCDAFWAIWRIWCAVMAGPGGISTFVICCGMLCCVVLFKKQKSNVHVCFDC